MKKTEKLVFSNWTIRMKIWS